MDEQGKGKTGEHSTLLRQALRAVEQMQRKVAEAESRAHAPIAIVGMGCRFPGGAEDAESFWELLREGREAIGEVPADRWDREAFYDPDPTKPGKMISKFGGFLSDVDKFDAGFFGIAPREAATLDPQQRMLLEVTWQALESAGIAPKSLEGSRTGLYLGMSSGDYAQLQLESGGAELLDVHFATGNGRSIASGRVSYLLGLRGPAVTIDTACSSSLVALHLACQALRSGECEMALAGGVNVMLSPETTVSLSQAHMLSPDGKSKAFDARADGFARAEGCGMLALKTLKQAEADGDRIFAVIRGTAINQDGASSSLTAPNGPAQEALMRDALKDAGMSASAIGYIEAHGTGTPLGDPIELRALGAVYGAAREANAPLPVGSLKTNFGHMEAAAGVGGLMKLVLAMQHGMIPPHAGFESATPHVPWAQLRLMVQPKLTPWTVEEGKKRAGAVSSFGYSGTNAHVVIEEAPLADAAGVVEPGSAILPLSAKSETALRVLAGKYAALLESESAWSWGEIAATASAGRDAFRYRAAVVARDKTQAAADLRAMLAGSSFGAKARGQALGFLFTGQGSERPGMGLALLEKSGVFRAAVERLEKALPSADGVSALDKSFREIWTSAQGELERARYVQPALYAFGFALSELWRSWGVVPEVVMGHSLGEYVAATVAGVITPEEGIRLVVARGRLTEELAAPSGMVAIVASEAAVRVLLHAELSVAAVNGPASVVVSGPLAAIEDFTEKLAKEGLRHKRLRTTHGFHSKALEPMLDAFAAEAGKIEAKAPEVKWISNLTGREVLRTDRVDAEYWRKHLRETVLFGEGLRKAAKDVDLLLEVGAEPQLLALAEGNAIESERQVASIPRGGEAWDGLLKAAARLYTAGVDLNWKQVASPNGETWRRAALPGYPFERERYWFTDGRKATAKSGAGLAAGIDRAKAEHALLGARLRLRDERAVWHGVIEPDAPAHLSDHVVVGKRVLPGAAFLEMVLAAAKQLDAATAWGAADVAFLEPCIFDEPRLLETVVFSEKDGRRAFEIASAAVGSDAWTLHVTGVLEASAQADAKRVDVDAMQARAKAPWLGSALYERLTEAELLGFKPAFRTIATAWGNAGEGLVELKFLPEVRAEFGEYGMHPVALDASMQAPLSLVENEQPGAPALPASIERVRIWGDAAKLRYATATVRRKQGRAMTVDVLGLDADGHVLLAVDGLMLVEMRADADGQEWRGWVQQFVWEKAATREGDADGRRSVLLITSGTVGEPDSIGDSVLARALAEAALADAASVTVVREQESATEALARWSFAKDAGRKAEIFYLPGAEMEPVAVGASSTEAMAWQERVLGGALGWVQALLAAERLEETRLWLLSRHAAGPDVSRFEGATIEAFGRSVIAEHNDAEVAAVDLPETLEGVAQLWQLGASKEKLAAQYAIRNGAVWVPRLAPKTLRSAADALGAEETRRLYFPETGLMEDLKPRREARRVPVADEVEIAVAATAINFHEVLSALNPGHAQGTPPGGECSGVVVRVGPDVTDLKPGDEVVAIDAGLMADYKTTSRERVWRKPRGLSLHEAATLPIAYLTARWCLERVAKTQPGQWVLIHSGAGGVGIASIQEAQRIGARVLATAGSDAKRTLLREMGVEGVFDSRSTSFEQGVMEITGGRGVDVLLNSLAGDKVAASLRVMAHGGCFVELGEQTVLSAEEQATLPADLRYEVVRLRDELVVPTREALEDTAAVLKDVDAGLLKPLPWMEFALADVAEAFKTMAAGLHTGRVLIVPHVAKKLKRFEGFRKDGAYVVTGAGGGLGLKTVAWLAQEGAGCVLALGRSAASAEAEAEFARLREKGTEVAYQRCDVGEPGAVEAALQMAPTGFAIRGVVHCAGVWANGALENQTTELYREGLSPKVAGAWNLHQATRGMELDCFVLFSSIAAQMGSRGQSNYAAANAFLDGLARYRKEVLGLPALSVDWGAWSEVGAAVRSGMVERSERGGTALLSPAKGLALLRKLLEEDDALLLVLKADWKKWLTVFAADYPACADLLTDLIPAEGVTAKDSGKGWLASFAEQPQEKQKAALAARVEERVRAALSLSARTAIDPTRPLQEYGLDSLLAIELRNALTADLEAKLPQTLLFDYPTMGGLTEWLAEDVLKLEGSDGEPSEISADETVDVVGGVEDLSDEEVERLIASRMAGK
jgi:acyl transferase domain-containing protein/NADPH:quinone reductase-like Zn-dependent oxidoreductase/acyl carrier protein